MDRVLSLYAKGLTTGEIAAHLADVYGVGVQDTIAFRPGHRGDAGVVVQAMEDSPVDASWSKIRDGQVRNRPVYAAIGVDLGNTGPDVGRRRATVGQPNFGWQCTDLRNRGVKDIFFLVCDGLKGLPDSVSQRSRWPRCEPPSSI